MTGKADMTLGGHWFGRGMGIGWAGEWALVGQGNGHWFGQGNGHWFGVAGEAMEHWVGHGEGIGLALRARQ